MFKTLLSIKTESAHYKIANKYENMQSNTTIPSHRTVANTGSNRCRFSVPLSMPEVYLAALQVWQ